jgi:NitT/TauT family transport system substrate-binding protein
MLSTPQSFQAVQNAGADLGPVAPFLGEFLMMIWHVNDDWAKAHEKELLAFIRAHNKAVRYMSDPAHRQEVSQMLADAWKSSLDDALKTRDVCMQVSLVADGGFDSATERVRDTLAGVRRHQAIGAARPMSIFAAKSVAAAIVA